MIEFMLRMHETHTSLEVMQKMEKWIAEHQKVLFLSCCVTSKETKFVHSNAFRSPASIMPETVNFGTVTSWVATLLKYQAIWSSLHTYAKQHSVCMP